MGAPSPYEEASQTLIVYEGHGIVPGNVIQISLGSERCVARVVAAVAETSVSYRLPYWWEPTWWRLRRYAWQLRSLALVVWYWPQVAYHRWMLMHELRRLNRTLRRAAREQDRRARGGS